MPSVVPEILRAKVAVFVELFQKSEQIKHQLKEHARFLGEQAARVEAEAAQERMTFLAEAGTVLAGSLDYNQTFESVARLVVPKLADFCIIDHMDESGTLRQVAVAHSDPEKEPILRALRYPEPGEYQHAALRVFQSSRPGIRNKLDVRGIEKLFTEPLLEAVKQLKPTSYVALPCSPPRERG